MNDILLGALILFAGFFPVAIALYYSKQLLKRADMLYTMGKAERETTVKEMKLWLVGDQFTDHFKNVVNGRLGSDVKKIRNSIKEEAILQGIPPPAKKAIAKGVGGFLEDYGMSKKTTKGIEAAMEMLLSRKSKAEKQRDQDLVRQYAQDLGYNSGGPVQPIMPPIVE